HRLRLRPEPDVPSGPPQHHVGEVRSAGGGRAARHERAVGVVPSPLPIGERSDSERSEYPSEGHSPSTESDSPPPAGALPSPANSPFGRGEDWPLRHQHKIGCASATLAITLAPNGRNQRCRLHLTEATQRHYRRW